MGIPRNLEWAIKYIDWTARSRSRREMVSLNEHTVQCVHWMKPFPCTWIWKCFKNENPMIPSKIDGVSISVQLRNFRISLLAIKIQWLKVGSGSYVTEIKKVCTFAQTSIRAVLAQPPSPLSPLVESGSLMANLLRACLDRSRPAQPSWIRPGGSGGAENPVKNWSHQNRWRAEQILANHRLHS